MKKLIAKLHKEICLLEFNPIPFRKSSKNKKGTFLWEEYVVSKFDKNPFGKFLKEISEQRIDLIKKNTEEYYPEMIIFYGLSYKWCYLNEKLWGDELEREFEGENIGNYKYKYNLHHSILKYKDKANKSHKTHIFIIPHCSDPEANRYPLIGKKMLELLK